MLEPKDEGKLFSYSGFTRCAPQKKEGRAIFVLGRVEWFKSQKVDVSRALSLVKINR